MKGLAASLRIHFSTNWPLFSPPSVSPLPSFALSVWVVHLIFTLGGRPLTYSVNLWSRKGVLASTLCAISVRSPKQLRNMFAKCPFVQTYCALCRGCHFPVIRERTRPSTLFAIVSSGSGSPNARFVQGEKRTSMRNAVIEEGVEMPLSICRGRVSEDVDMCAPIEV